jgi:hypothetical protein
MQVLTTAPLSLPHRYDKAAIAERVQAANRAAHSHSKDGCCGGGCHE